MAPEIPAPSRYTWRTFLTFFGLGILVYVIVTLGVLLWFDRDVAFWAGAGASTPIVLSGHKGWRDRRVLPWVLLLIIAMGVGGGLLGAIIGS